MRFEISCRKLSFGCFQNKSCEADGMTREMFLQSNGKEKVVYHDDDESKNYTIGIAFI